MLYHNIMFTSGEGVARLTLNRPERLNAFTLEMHEEVADALGRVEASSETRVLLLTGSGRGFCAGQDLGERKRRPGDRPADLGESLELLYGPLIRRLTGLPLPVVCAVNGVAAGAGQTLHWRAIWSLPNTVPVSSSRLSTWDSCQMQVEHGCYRGSLANRAPWVWL
jgi:2-(1,2-epoxy-1,2-dihydrophenyl)acetyl-CoA isomerase